jgi:hypothetical protein
MKRNVLLGIGALLAFAGCKTQETTYISPVRLAPISSGEDNAKSSFDRPYQPFYDKTGTVASVRTGEVVKAYGVKRYVDPADPRVMHERHAIYRIEEGPGWVMQVPQGRQGILLGPVVGLKKVEDAPAPRTSEVARELLEARQTLDKNNDQLSQIRANQEGIGQFLKGTAEAQAKLALIADRLNRRLQRVETKLGGQEPGPPSVQGDTDEGRDPRTVPKGPNQD